MPFKTKNNITFDMQTTGIKLLDKEQRRSQQRQRSQQGLGV